MAKEIPVSSALNYYTEKSSTSQEGKLPKTNKLVKFALRGLRSAGLILSPLIIACAEDNKAVPPNFAQEPNRPVDAGGANVPGTPEPTPTARPIGGNTTFEDPALEAMLDKINRGEASPAEIVDFNTKTEALATKGETKPPTSPEAPKAQCSFSSDPKFCGLAEVYKMTNPRTGEFQGVAIRRPEDPETDIIILAPFDGWYQPSISNPNEATFSKEKNVMNGFAMEGFDFVPTNRADAVQWEKGQKIGSLKRTDYAPLPHLPEYQAFIDPSVGRDRAAESALIEQNFSTGKTVKELPFQKPQASKPAEQGGVLLGGVKYK